jgi:uncharacterized BrkB/YihY/UPF0761 family membrane protein
MTMLTLIILTHVILAVLTHGMVFAHHKAEYSFFKDNRTRHANAAFPTMLSMVPLVGVFVTIMAFIMTDFARHGIRFK